MNIFESLYCNQYFELKPKGKAFSAKKNGTVLLSVALLLNLITLFIILGLVTPGFFDFIGDLLKDIFGRTGGRAVGKILGAVGFGLSYLFVRFTYDKEEKYQSIITKFESYSIEQQEKISTKGLRYFYITLGSLAIAGLLAFMIF